MSRPPWEDEDAVFELIIDEGAFPFMPFLKVCITP
jgi:hypothetical protein